MAGAEALPGLTHYYRGNDPGAWATNVPTFGRVRATGIYPGIDLEYYGRDRQLEYDFLVAPGADPSQIVLAFDGVDRATVDATGDLLLQVGDADDPPASPRGLPDRRRRAAGGRRRLSPPRQPTSGDRAG